MPDYVLFVPLGLAVVAIVAAFIYERRHADTSVPLGKPASLSYKEVVAAAKPGQWLTVDPDKPLPSSKPAVEVEVSKAIKALDKAGVKGRDYLATLVAVRRGELSGDDVVKAHAKPEVEQPKKEG